MYQFYLVALFLLSRFTLQLSVPPTWISSDYLRAGSFSVINGTSTVGSATSPVPSATMTFSTAFSVIPNLVYGISHYESDDNLGEEMYEVNRTSISTSSFSVIVKIQGNTDIWIVRVRYVGVDKAFPHHLNTFDNVPCNYPSASFTAFSTRTTAQTTYTNTINYTTQAATISSSYNKFSLPLTNNKILLLMTSMFFDGKGGQSSSPLYAINIRASATPISIDQYNIVIIAGDQVAITRLHYSMLIFDQVDVQASGQYFLHYERIDFATAGGSVFLPVQLVPNAIMAWTDFSSDRTESLIKFFLDFQILGNGSHGIYMPLSAPRSASRRPITRFGFTLFYLKSWICPTGYYFDLSTNMCVDCTLSFCAQCLNATYCKTCNSGYNLNIVSGLCQPIPCTLFQCLTCANTTYCSVCNTANSYYMVSGSCLYCDNSLDYFINATSLLCQACTLLQCTTCTSLTQCLTCNNANDYFINTTDYLCYPCTLVQCTTCTSLTQCQTCNNANGYFINTTDFLCYPCLILYCSTCLNLNQCQVCDPGYLVNTGNGQCQVCPLVGCITCSTISTCSLCDGNLNYVLQTNLTCTLCQTASNYFANSTTNTCELCSLQQCTTCSSLSECQVCNVGNSYYLNTNLTCSFCDPNLNEFINITDSLCYPCLLNNCLECQSLLICNLCDLGFWLDVNTGLCVACSITGCLNCTDASTCVQCDNNNNYVLLPNFSCQECQSSLNYFTNPTLQICQLCTLSQCLSCASLVACQNCNISNDFYLDNGVCLYCDPSTNRFINISNSLCELCNLVNCLTCVSLSSCSLCDIAVNYLLNTTDNLCYACTVPNCLECASFTACLKCDTNNQFFLNSSTGQCQPCTLQGCLNCSSLTSCFECDINNNYGLDYTSVNRSLCGPCNASCVCDGYGQPWLSNLQQCTPVCGDGVILLSEECDDGNIQPNDGCSNICTVQANYLCQDEPSNCTEIITPPNNIQTPEHQNSISRQTCNKLLIKLTKPPQYTLTQITSNLYIQNNQINIESIKQQDSYYSIIANYRRDIINESIVLVMPDINLRVAILYDSLLPLVVYSEQQCRVVEELKDVVQVANIVSYGVMFLSLISCKIVGLELFGVLQIAYFSLASHSFLNIYLQPLIKLKVLNGLNIAFITQESSYLPTKIKQMGFSASFFNNCNIMLMCMGAHLLITGLLYLTSVILAHQKLRKYSQIFLKQGYVTLILFNAFNISFSAGVHLRYADPQDSTYLISILAMVLGLGLMVGSVMALQLGSQKNYGEFKQKFKDNTVCKLFIPLTVVYRMILGLYIALKNDEQESTLLILAFCLIFILYLSTNLPYRDTYQNYRSTIIHITTIYILFTSNYYREMKSNTPLQIKARIYTPAIIQLVLISGCIGVSVILGLYQLYLFIRGICQKRRIAVQKDIRTRKESYKSTQESHINVY